MYLVRENLFIGNINAAAEVLLGGNKEITHILSVLSSASIGFFSEWKSSFSVPTKEIRTVYVGGSGPDENLEGDGSVQAALCSKKIHYVLENAGHDLKLVRMAVPLRDMESENLLDYLDVCLDFIDESRKNGSVLVHCFAGVSRSATIITAYLMRTERISLQDALESLRQSNISVCPNDGFKEQLSMFEDMGFKVDHSSTIYKRIRWKVSGDGTWWTRTKWVQFRVWLTKGACKKRWGDEINLGDDESLFPSFVESSSGKRKKSKNVANNRSTKSKTSSFEEKLDVVLDALSTKSTQIFPPNSPSPTISDCMNIVITFPGFNEGSKKYSQALRVFIKKQNREAFMFPTSHEAKMEFLKLLMEE